MFEASKLSRQFDTKLDAAMIRRKIEAILHGHVVAIEAVH
jgi:hypothetical protein